VRHLLNQTSGLPSIPGELVLVDFDDHPDATERQVRALSALKLTRPAGEKCEYSNLNYNILGLIVEVASAEPYAGYIQSHIFNPLGMRHSYTTKTEAEHNDLAKGHRHYFSMPFPAPNLPIPHGSLPSGQLISCAEDMAHYLIAQLNGGRYGDVQILSPEGIAEMHSPAAKFTLMGTDMGDYGMGWFIEQPSQGTRISHDGTAPDYFSYMALLPDQNRGMVLLLNANEFFINMAFKFVGGDAALVLAGGQPGSVPWAVVPWSLRAFLIIPVLQILGVFFTLRAIRRWRKDASRRPGPIRKWFHIGLPAIPNLVLVFCALYLLTSGVLKFFLYFMADLSWLALICGSFSLVWTFLRTGLLLRTLRKPSSP
jgi:CubicO group peptidase (beta-lactamase class C family)